MAQMKTLKYKILRIQKKPRDSVHKRMIYTEDLSLTFKSCDSRAHVNHAREKYFLLLKFVML